MLRRTSDGAVIDVDDDALNPDGTLRDGGRLRVPLMFRDSNRGTASDRATPTLRFADGRTDAPIGSRPGFVIDAGGGAGDSRSSLSRKRRGVAKRMARDTR